MVLAGLFFALSLALTSSCAGPADRSRDGGDRLVRLIPVDPATVRGFDSGPVELQTAFELKSSHRAFGGLSGVWVAPDGATLMAVTDRGVLWRAAMTHDSSGRLTDVTGWRFFPATEQLGQHGGQTWVDAEDLADDGNGGLVVAYEGRHRFERLSRHDLAQPATVFAAPKSLGGPNNFGIETLAGLGNGQLLAIAEGSRTQSDVLPAWLIGPDQTFELTYQPDGNWLPTGGDYLDGRVYIIERGFSLLGGLRARIVTLAASDVVPGAHLKGAELGSFKVGSLGENFEAIGARALSANRVALYLLTDDNFNLLQRTILLQVVVDLKAPASN